MSCAGTSTVRIKETKMPTERDEQQNKLLVHVVDQKAPWATLLLSRKDELLQGLLAMESSRDSWRTTAYFFAAMLVGQYIFRAVFR